MSTTPTRAASQLRALADALDRADDMPINVAVYVSPGYEHADRVAAVDVLAVPLSLAAAPAKNGGSWYHEARDDRDGVNLRLYTYIDAPAQHCACGAVCTHTTAGGAS
jgi:hypothetical protein